MPRELRTHENQKRSKARRALALARIEFAYPSEPREAPAGATSFPIKKINMADRAAIDAFISNRKKEEGTP